MADKEQAALHVARAKLALEAATVDFQQVSGTAWNTYEDTAKGLRRELELQVRQDYGAKAAAVDTNCMALLSSGILKVEDYAALATEFEGNSTMTRLIRKHIQDAAKACTDDPEERRRLNNLADSVRMDEEVYLEQWDNIARAAAVYSGTSNPNRPDFRLSMADRFEAQLGGAIADF